MPEKSSRPKPTLKLYGQLASWWPLLSHPDEYGEEAAFYLTVLQGACAHEIETLLELGSGGAYVHTRPGGAALFAPDHVAETFRASTDHGGRDGEGRSLRYLEWTWDPDPTNTTYTVDYVCVMRDADGAVQVEHDRHIEGLFARDVWIDSLRRAGFTPDRVPFDHSELPPGAPEVFVGRRPVERVADGTPAASGR